MKKMALYGKFGEGKFTIVDDEDFEYLKEYHWFLGKEGYVKRVVYIKNGKRRSVYMHRLIMNIVKGFYGDHINHDKLDNRKYNLRSVTAQQSVMNRRKQINNSSGYKGVRELKDQLRIKKWLSYIRFNRKTICVGLFHTKEEAALAYNEAAVKYFGEFANLNQL